MIALSRLLDHVLLLLLLLGVALLVLKRELLIPSRRARWALRVAVATWVALWLSSTPLVAKLLLRSLQPPPALPADVVPPALRAQTALVVLGSGEGVPYRGVPPRERLDPASAARVAGAIRWYGLTQPSAVITSVGPLPERDHSVPDGMTDALTHAGVPAARVWPELRSTNTRENARFSVELGHARGITRFVVVTSALHMPRALREFRRAGVEAVGAPVDYLGVTFDGIDDFIPSSWAVGQTEQCVHEYLGLLKP